MDISQTIILTERLMLVPISHEFSENIFENFTSEITTYMAPKSPDTIEETETFITTSIGLMQKNKEFIVVILNKDTDEFLGVGAIHKIYTFTPELGIWIKKMLIEINMDEKL